MFNYFFDVLHQDVLIHLSLILMGLKAQSTREVSPCITTFMIIVSMFF